VVIELIFYDVRLFCNSGDSAYKTNSHLTSYHRAEDFIPEFKEWNKKMKKVRVSIEWNYGVTASLFKAVNNLEKLKLLNNQKRVSKIYTVATILRNIHAGYYGNQSSQYFNLTLPPNFVRHYINQTDFP
jgi:hypothetical protein